MIAGRKDNRQNALWPAGRGRGSRVGIARGSRTGLAPGATRPPVAAVRADVGDPKQGYRFTDAPSGHATPVASPREVTGKARVTRAPTPTARGRSVGPRRSRAPGP
jgi:hypothetical protein